MTSQINQAKIWEKKTTKQRSNPQKAQHPVLAHLADGGHKKGSDED